MNILSLFDGISCGYLACQRAGIQIDDYFASEVDKYAEEISKANFPDIVRLGDVREIKYERGSLYFGRSKGPLLPIYSNVQGVNIDLLIGGSPCQGFSFAGKQLNFEDPRSKLFFEYVRVLKEVKPKYFLLENVRMKKEYERTISQYLDFVEPTILINSSLVSAQNRERLYWVGELQENGKYRTLDIPQPEDRNILLKDILQENVDKKYFLSDKIVEGFLRKKGGFSGKFKLSEGVKIFQTPRGKNAGGFHEEKSPTLTSNQWEYNNTLFIPEATQKGFVEIQDGECFDGTHITSSTRRGRKMETKTNCMTSGNFDFFRYEKGRIRRLTPVECERLQTIPDNFTKVLIKHKKGEKYISDSHRYKSLGNAWTVDVIAHILSHLPKN